MISERACQDTIDTKKFLIEKLVDCNWLQFNCNLIQLKLGKNQHLES